MVGLRPAVDAHRLFPARGPGHPVPASNVNTSLCCPSRSEIMTGLYEHHTGVDANDAPLLRPTLPRIAARRRLPHDARRQVPEQLAELRSAAGVRPVALRGRGTEPSGGVTAQSLHQRGRDMDAVHEAGRRTSSSEQAADFIDTTPVDQPFFVMYTPMSPHLPADDTRHQDMAVPLRHVLRASMSTCSRAGTPCTLAGGRSHRRRSPLRTITSSIWRIGRGRWTTPSRPS